MTGSVWMGRERCVLEPENFWPPGQSVNQDVHAMGVVGARVPP